MYSESGDSNLRDLVPNRRRLGTKVGDGMRWHILGGVLFLLRNIGHDRWRYLRYLQFSRPRTFADALRNFGEAPRACCPFLVAQVNYGADSGASQSPSGKFGFMARHLPQVALA